MGTPAEPIDERLQSLLATEQRLEARLREAEVAAAARLQAARHALTNAEHEALSSLDELLREEERVDQAAHEAALRSIEEERAAALEQLTRVDDAALERLAKKVLARITEGGEP